MTILQSRIFTFARMLATDEELCRICGLTPAELERHRALIDEAKAAGMVSLRFERAQEVARRGKAKGQQQ
jgi:hypothetical protein